MTRRAFSTWMQQSGMALTNRGQDFNSAIAQFYPFATNVDAVLGVLNRDNAATRTLLRDTGQVFGALAQSPAQLQGFIRNSNAVFTATAARNQALQAAIPALAGFTVATRLTVDRIHRFAIEANPLINELRPAARQLSPTLIATVTLAPELRTLMENLAPLTAASKAGVPAFEKFLTVSVPWLTRLKPYLGNFIPIFNYINTYRREIAAFFANGTATTQASGLNITQTKILHYLRISNPVNPETLTNYQRRLNSNRGNPYIAPGAISATFERPICFWVVSMHREPSTCRWADDSGYARSDRQERLLHGNSRGATMQGAGSPRALTTGQHQAFPTLKPLP